MNFYVMIAFNLSILIAGVMAILRFKKINKAYHPFIYCLWIGCLNELLSFLLLKQHLHTIVNNNIYVFLESILLTWLFKNLGLWKERKYGYWLLLALFTGAWIAENFIFGTVTHNSTYFRIIYSFALVLMSIHLMNTTIAKNRKNILTNANFLLCLAFITYFTYKVIILAFAIYGVSSTQTFLVNIYIILVYINLGTNLLYALAILWMPEKLKYSLPL